ncbi:hypothetical protein T484DRAFT_1824303, partial [Baffinella frigidus]
MGAPEPRRPAARGRALLLVALAVGVASAAGEPIGLPRAQRAIRHEDATMRSEERAENGEELGFTRDMDNWGGEDWSRTGDALAKSGKQFQMSAEEAAKVLPTAQRAAPCTPYLARLAMPVCRWAACGNSQAPDCPYFDPAPPPVTLSSESQVFGVNDEDDLVEAIHRDLAKGGKFVAEHWDGGAASTIVNVVTHGITTPPAKGARGRAKSNRKAQALFKVGGDEGKVPDVLPGMEL